MTTEEIIDDIRGYNFVPIQVLMSALWNGRNEYDIAIVLRKVISEGSTPLLMLDNLDYAVAASDEAKSWTIRFLEKCAQKPRLIAARRVDARVGWKAESILSHEYVSAILDDVGLSELFAPEATVATSAENGKPPGSAGVTKSEILCVEWPVPNGAPTMANVLREIPKWVEPACKKVGRPGKGAGGSHLWNPAILAFCLVTKTPQKKWAVGKGTLTGILRTNYSEYLAQWETISTDL